MQHGRRRFVGRSRELCELEDGLAAAADGRGQLFLLVGEPGIGKTRLADEVADMAARRSLTVARGRCWEAGGAPPYRPWIQVFGTLQRSVIDAPWRFTGLLDQAAPELHGAASERFRIFEAVADGLCDLTREHPALVVLEDLHAAEQSSLRLLHFLAATLRSAHVMMVGTYRTVEAHLAAGVEDLLALAAREGRILALRPLAVDEVVELMESTPSTAEASITARVIHRMTGGNPLFVDEMLRILDAQGPAWLDHPTLSDGLRAAIRHHLRVVPDEVLPLLRTAAVLGRDFELALLSEILGGVDETVLAGVERAVALDVLRSASPGRYSFKHALIRDALLEALPAIERDAQHRRIAETLEHRHAEDPEAPLAEIVHHYRAAGAPCASATVRTATTAASQAVRRLAFEDAVRLYETALEALHIAAPADAGRRAELLIGLGVANIRAGATAEGRAACRQAADLARTLRSTELLARAALAHGTERVPGVVDRDIVALLEEALLALGTAETPLSARVMARLAAARQPAHDPRGPAALAWRAVELARSTCDEATRLAILNDAGAAHLDYITPQEAMPLDLELLQLATARGERVLALGARARMIFHAINCGDMPSVHDHIDGYEALARDLGPLRWRWQIPLLRGMCALVSGRFGDDERFTDEAADLAARANDPSAASVIAAHRLGALLLHEQHDELQDRAETVVADFNVPEDYRTLVRGGLHAWCGNDDAARALVLPLPDEFLLSQLPNTAMASFVLDAVAVITDTARVAAIHEAALPLAQTVVYWNMIAMIAVGPLARSCCVTAAALGRWAEAQRHHDAALATASRMQSPPFIARIQYDWGRALLARGRPEDREPALAALADSRRIAEELGSTGLLALIQRLVPRGNAARSPAVQQPAAAGPGITQLLTLELKLEGQIWTLRGLDTVVRLADSRGMRMLAHLMAHPGQEFHALELSGTAMGAIDGGDAGPRLDHDAIHSYRTRLRELRQQVAEAESWNDMGRLARTQQEIELLEAEVKHAIGLGHRERRVGQAAERARVNVQRRIAAVMTRVKAANPLLGRHLAASVRTGMFCSYQP